MANQKKTPIAIIGGGISGLTLAALLERAGLDYLVIDSQELGGMIRGQNEHGISLDYGLKSVPIGSALNKNPLVVLKERLGLRLQFDSWTEPPQTLAKNEFVPFVGFGENKLRILITEYNYYLTPERIIVSQGWQKLVDQLLQIIPAEKIMTKSHVTGVGVSDDAITSLTLNGSTQLNVGRVVCTLSPSVLSEIFPKGVISVKLLQRISKTQTFTAINLDLATTQKISEAKNFFILNDNVDQEFYVLGQFPSNIDTARNLSSVQISSWLTLVDQESLQDDENGSKAIRTMKKLIKRMFPELLENVKWERLLVVPTSIGHFEHLQLEKNGTLPGLVNFWVAGAQVGGVHRNILNAIQSSTFAADQIIRQVDPQRILRSSVEVQR